MEPQMAVQDNHSKSGAAHWSSHPAAHGHSGHVHHQDHAAGMAVDPVCGMKVDPSTARHKIGHDGKTFYFCSERCRTKFEDDPTKYVHGKAH
jgi:Cu+-exporting ATPase